MRSENSLSKQRLIILILVMAAVFSPSVLQWIVNPQGAWYRPFLLWGLVILVAFWLQRKGSSGDDL
ncbi:hypothetical protein [Halioxenophilus sp. WMMB6]|uniref:hypothetical protein n=1 Tax=Halioxenophilus sp. WMMB6 TaxID=3073815 RepID=UPI00295E3D46|nr:hypothetical protein [Halioxenophilus sp. WMMB6]